MKMRVYRWWRDSNPPYVSHLAAAAILALFTFALYFSLLFTNRVLASGDILHYFYPYRDYAAEALRQGRIPLWNPYIFAGAPFLANPQAAVLYPLHWPLSWLPVTKQIYWSGALHTWLLGLGAYLLMRRWAYGWSAGMVTALTLAGSGFYGGLMGQINQMNGAAWLPWMVLVLEGRRPAEHDIGGLAASAMKASLFGALVCLTLLAGHTQTAYINLFGTGVWIAARGLARYDWQAARERRVAGGGWLAGIVQPGTLRSCSRRLLPDLAVYFTGVSLGAVLSGAQLLPSLELSGLGLRSEGLRYIEATSFSLNPLRLHWTLLPTYGLVDMSVLFDTAGYTEFIAYVGLVPLALALWSLFRKVSSPARFFGLLWVILGLFLALGRYNPLYYLFYKLVPGFDLFRTPARWMMLYTLGMAVLAGIGSQNIFDWWRRRHSPRTSTTIEHPETAAGENSTRAGRTHSQMQAPRSANVVILAAQSLYVLLLVGGELLFAAQALPHTHPTAPHAVYGVRTAVAHLLTAPERTLHPAAMGRFLSMSTITFDPGDMTDWRGLYRSGEKPVLGEAAFTEFIIGLKSQEILAPNLPLFWRVPALDGFDGGVLPLQRYNQLMSLLIPSEQLVPDGRIREQMATVPAAPLLARMGVRYVITDKVRDLWFQDVYYDRQIGATLASEDANATDRGRQQIVVDAPGSYSATAVGLIGYVEGSAQSRADMMERNQVVAAVEIVGQDGSRLVKELTAGAQPGAHLGDRRLGSPMADASGATVAYQDVTDGAQEYLALFQLSTPREIDSLVITHQGEDAVEVTIQAATLIDQRTGTFVSLVPSGQGVYERVHSGDVKMYEALAAGRRLALTNQATAVPSAAAAVEEMDRVRDDASVAVVEADANVLAELDPARPLNGTAHIVEYTAERVVIHTQSSDPALLILRDAYYPGWTVTVDGEAGTVYPTDVLFRGALVPAGEHEIVFAFSSDTWRQGLLLSSFGLILWAVLLGVGRLRRLWRGIRVRRL